MCTTCAQLVHNLCSTCAQLAHIMRQIICETSASNTCRICDKYASIMCQLCAHYASLLCTLCAHYASLLRHFCANQSSTRKMSAASLGLFVGCSDEEIPLKEIVSFCVKASTAQPNAQQSPHQTQHQTAKRTIHVTTWYSSHQETSNKCYSVVLTHKTDSRSCAFSLLSIETVTGFRFFISDG